MCVCGCERVRLYGDVSYINEQQAPYNRGKNNNNKNYKRNIM